MLKKLQVLVIGKLMDKPAYMISDNFYRLLGVEPGTFEPKLSSIIKYIHPDDVDYVIEKHNNSFSEETTNIMFRFIIDDGTTKYIKSVGSFTKTVMMN
jgi:hypothetical protein